MLLCHGAKFCYSLLHRQLVLGHRHFIEKNIKNKLTYGKKLTGFRTFGQRYSNWHKKRGWQLTHTIKDSETVVNKVGHTGWSSHICQEQTAQYKTVGKGLAVHCIMENGTMGSVRCGLCAGQQVEINRKMHILQIYEPDTVLHYTEMHWGNADYRGSDCTNSDCRDQIFLQQFSSISFLFTIFLLQLLWQNKCRTWNQN